jgi:hypothetical protein
MLCICAESNWSTLGFNISLGIAPGSPATGAPASGPERPCGHHSLLPERIMCELSALFGRNGRDGSSLSRAGQHSGVAAWRVCETAWEVPKRPSIEVAARL